MQDTPKYFKNSIGIDTGCVFGGYLTALIITEHKIENIAMQAKINTVLNIKKIYGNKF